MLSDEERKAIEWLKKADWFSARLYAPTILNLIEKQSKEIEELKEEKAKRQWVHIKENGEVEPLFYVSEDKIKARIKELEEYLYRGSIKDDFLMIRIKAKIQELQSLLEKE